MSEDNSLYGYPDATDDEERDAHTATFANLARAAIFKHVCDKMPDNDPWAEKVYDVLHDAMVKLEALALDEVRNRPGMLEIGQAHHTAWMEETAEARSAFEATIADIAALGPQVES